MSNSAALVLFLLLAGLAAADILVNGGASLLFLGRRLLDLIGFLAFWR